MSSAPAALAQDALSEARSALDEARFSDAVRLYDDIASRPSGLDRAALVRLLRDRALARAALRDTAGARVDLVALFSLQPDAELGEEAPPSLARLADEVRSSSGEPLAVTADATSTPDAWEVRASVTGDPASIARAVRVIEIAETGPVTHDGPIARIPAGDELRYVVEVVSFGGAVVERLGSATRPRVARRAPVASPPPRDDGDDAGVWIGVGVGAGVLLVAAAVVTALALALPGDGTQLGFPMEIE